MNTLNHLTVIGGGSWATALVRIFSDSGVQITWHLRSPETVAHVKEFGRNPNYLSFLQLKKECIQPTSDIHEAVRSSGFILFAVPSAYLENIVSELEAPEMEDKNLLVSIKGIIPHHGLVPSDFLGKKFGVPPARHIILGGPCHAEEVALERKTYITVAAEESALAALVGDSIQLDFIKAIVSDDPLGIEMSAILKNIVGIACGIAKGLNYGDNFQAVLVSNALREVGRFIGSLDEKPRDLTRSGYFGDLLVTAYSEYSRNRTFGQMIGRGYTVHLAQTEMDMVAEGYYAVDGIYNMARKMGQEMPVVSTVYRILYNKISPYIEFKLLEQKLI
ncbi:MAG TPA: NAD(P)H-dependent glycerol-3-phosphate dehydrogenase [Chitinophagaceae bacterium]|nr:NAD(P)H-dependent glycerol-3-phosphate dehydrogenase [Chitinophagaceae bacterium]